MLKIRLLLMASRQLCMDKGYKEGITILGFLIFIAGILLRFIAGILKKIHLSAYIYKINHICV